MFNGIVSFIVVFGTLSLVSWSFYTVQISQINNIEKAFGFSSSETGWLLTIWEIGYMVCTIFASYFGPRAHIPRVLGIVTVMCGLSGFVIAQPHFIVYSDTSEIFSEYADNQTVESDTTDVHLCDSGPLLNTTESDPSSTEFSQITKTSSKSLAYAFFVIGMILQGAGKAPCYPYSAKYVDDNVDKQKTGFYIATISSIAVLGLAIGYGLGSLIGSIYVTLEGTTLSSTDSRYIGAWWLGFVIVGSVTILTAIPMFCFPRRFTTNREEKSIAGSHHTHTSFIKEIKHVGSTLLSVVNHSVYILTLISTCFQILSFNVILGFEPKYMENQFALPSWQINIVLGAISITAYSFGCLLGGFITRKWDLPPYKSILLILILITSVLFILVGAAFLGCSHRTIHNSPTDEAYLSADFNCDCNSTEFLAICGGDGKTYFSACHAGCSEISENKLSNCSGIPGGEATMGVCPRRCDMVWGYTVAKFAMNLIDAVASIPIFLVFLRSAGEKNKALAIGLSAAVTSLAAWLPGPVVGGKIIDSSCLIWNTARTSGKYCAYYNIEWQRYRLHGCMIGLRVVAIIILGIALYKARKLPHWPIDETNEFEMDETATNRTSPEATALQSASANGELPQENEQ